MGENLKYIILIVVFILCFLVMPSIYAYADIERGYDSTGGEALLALALPFGIWWLLDIIDKALIRRKERKKHRAD